MIIIAHRGASAYKKENTLKAFKKAFEMNALYLETDIQRTADGKLILYHDYKLKTGEQIKDCSYSYLKRFEVPLLEELFAVAPQNFYINLEIKNDGNIYPDIEKQIFDFLNSQTSKNNILISSFDFQTLKKIRILDNNIKIGVLTRDFDIKQPLQLNAYSVNISHKRITPQIIKTCKENKLKVLVYTVNDISLAKELEDMGVDGIFSDYPDLFYKQDTK